MPPVPWHVRVKQHPGSTTEEIEDEPEWGSGHQHRVGYKNRDDRWPGLTHLGEEEEEDVEEAVEEYKELAQKEKKGDLVNFRDVITHEKDFHLRRPENRSLGWRYVLDCTEDEIRNNPAWPANIKKKKKEEEAKKKEQEEKGNQDGIDGEGKKDAHSDSEQRDNEPEKEHEWQRKEGEGSKHQDAYADGSQDQDQQDQQNQQPNGDKKEHKSEYQQLREKYSPQEISLLRTLQHEKEYIAHLKQNDGKGRSPQTHNRSEVSIDEQDQFSPDNWLPRSSDLIRQTGKHPMNAEAPLDRLFEAGLITPNELHYTRNHGAVPRLLWEFHKLEVGDNNFSISMDELKSRFDPINIPVALACDGNRRKELNLIKRSKGFNFGAGAVSCAYWKGALLRDILLAAGIPENMPTDKGQRWWANFAGADNPSEGKYETCIPFEYAMDPTNDVMVAYEMNDVPLPPDHGYPIRVMIPGYVGGRCVKWLQRIWITDYENDSHYHRWDNRVLPSFITEKDGEFAEALFNHPDTACNEQNLNSVIVKPAAGERIPLKDIREGRTYRIEGYAYDGGGHEVQRVEVSLDDGKTWLYCIRKFPDNPIRHGNKFWSWLHWHVDVGIVHLLQASSVTVRCFNVFKNTQPQYPSWNVLGMMNNCWYVVKSKISHPKGDEEGKVPCLEFQHPTVPKGDGGWMQPSVENKLAAAKQEAGTPQKQFTRQEIEKHDKENDCWIVYNGNVYDATSVLGWHPGGKAAIMSHAGKVHAETTDEFESVHDGFAHQKLKECILGTVTDKARNFIKANAEKAAKERAASSDQSANLALQKHRWVPVTLIERKSVSEDTRTYTFRLPDGTDKLGLGTCQHVQIGFHLEDKMLIRSYTPTRPLLPAPEDAPKGDDSGGQTHVDTPGKLSNAEEGDDDRAAMRDGKGTLDLTVKTYFPDDNQPGGALSNILDCMPLNEEVEMRGPTGEIVYTGQGRFVIDGEEKRFGKVSLVLGGSGITPGYALICRVLLGKGDRTEIRVIDANKSEKDILLNEELDELQQKSNGRLKVTHILSHPGDDWKGLKGHVNEGTIKDALFPPTKGDGKGGNDSSAVFLCGPPAMIQKAALPALKDWGYVEDENVFGF